MISRALDSNNDLVIKKGQFDIVNDGAEVVQHVRSRLLFYTEEWFLDTISGTPYFQSIFIKPVNLANVESILKQRILQTPGVNELTEFAMNYDGGNSRKLTVVFSALTDFGFIDQDEVTING